jgi:hypothetical protein
MWFLLRKFFTWRVVRGKGEGDMDFVSRWLCLCLEMLSLLYVMSLHPFFHIIFSCICFCLRSEVVILLLFIHSQVFSFWCHLVERSMRNGIEQN